MNQSNSPIIDSEDEVDRSPLREQQRTRKISGWVNLSGVIAMVISLGLTWFKGASQLADAEKTLTAREQAEQKAQAAFTAAETEAQKQKLDRLNADHRIRMSDVKLINGTKAREIHQIEWGKRLDHDPSLAHTFTERGMIDMEQIGTNAQISAQSALEKVATLASPSGSRVLVEPAGDSFSVLVAFRMSAVVEGETGATTKHTTHATMRAEIRQISAQIIRDLYAYCGSRGIAKVSLTCNHTTMQWLKPPSATDEELAILRSRAQKANSRLYRVVMEGAPARNVMDWRLAREEDVLKLVKVEFDGIDAVNISVEEDLDIADKTDATDPLQF